MMIRLNMDEYLRMKKAAIVCGHQMCNIDDGTVLLTSKLNRYFAWRIKLHLTFLLVAKARAKIILIKATLSISFLVWY